MLGNITQGRIINSSVGLKTICTNSNLCTLDTMGSLSIKEVSSSSFIQAYSS